MYGKKTMGEGIKHLPPLGTPLNDVVLQTTPSSAQKTYWKKKNKINKTIPQQGKTKNFYSYVILSLHLFTSDRMK